MNKPEWVMLGVPVDADAVCLFASKKLNKSQLEQVRDGWDDFSSLVRYRDPRIILNVEMREYLMIYGPDYAACLRVLLEQWNPDAPTEIRELSS